MKPHDHLTDAKEKVAQEQSGATDLIESFDNLAVSVLRVKRERDDLLAHLVFAVKLLEAFPMMNATAQVDAMRTAIARAKGK